MVRCKPCCSLAISVRSRRSRGCGTAQLQCSNISNNGPAILNWYLLTLYPLQQGQHVRDIRVTASLRLPPDWKAGTALPIESTRDGVIHYKTVSLETLLDSPA